MAALVLANKTFKKGVPMEFLKLLSEKYSGKEFTGDSLSEDQDLVDFFKETKKKKQKMDTSPQGSTQRALQQVNTCKCLARVWANGYGGQCTRNPKDDNHLCTMHQKYLEKQGKWWLGMITEKRPEAPIHPNGNRHEWKITQDGVEIVKQKSPKKGCCKNKTTTNLSVEEIKSMLDAAKKKEEQQSETTSQLEHIEENSETHTKVYQGIEYKYNPDTNMIHDPTDSKEICNWDEEEGCPKWEDTESEEKHEQYIKSMK